MPPPQQPSLPHLHPSIIFASFFVPTFSKSLFAEKARHESLWLWVVFVTLAALALWHALKGLFDVLATASPGWFAALTAGYL